MTTSWVFCDIKYGNMRIHITQILTFFGVLAKRTKDFGFLFFFEFKFSLRNTVIFMLGSWKLETQRSQVPKSHFFDL